MICKRRLGVNNKIRVERTVLLLALCFWRVADAGKPTLRTPAKAAQPTGRIEEFCRAACTALQVQLGRTCRENGRGDDDAGDAHKFVHRVGGEVAELLQVEPGLDENLYSGQGRGIGGSRGGRGGGFRVFGERKQDGTRGFGSSVLKLKENKRRETEITRKDAYQRKNISRSLLDGVC